MKFSLIVFFCYCLLTLGFSLSADEFLLKSGATLKADIIKENEKYVFVDLGFKVLQIPRLEIENIQVEQKGENEVIAKVKKEESSFYYQGNDWAPSNIEALVKKVGEAVVLVSTPSGRGSGFIINDDGYLITNAHVIQNEKKISITMFFNNKKGMVTKVLNDVRIISSNAFGDLALLKIDEDIAPFKFTKVAFADFKSIKSGEKVFAIGNPFGLKRSVSQGIVSTKNRNMQGLRQLFIQTTAAINSGNSGGPLFNLKGEVIGVNSRGFVKSLAEGLNFAIPCKYVIDFIENRESFAYDKNNPNNGYHYFKIPVITNSNIEGEKK